MKSWFFGAKGDVGLVIDGQGNFGVIEDGGYIQPGLAAGWGGGITVYNVDTIDELNGYGQSDGGNVGNLGLELERAEDGELIGVQVAFGEDGRVGGYTMLRLTPRSFLRGPYRSGACAKKG